MSSASSQRRNEPEYYPYGVRSDCAERLPYEPRAVRGAPLRSGEPSTTLQRRSLEERCKRKPSPAPRQRLQRKLERR